MRYLLHVVDNAGYLGYLSGELFIFFVSSSFSFGFLSHIKTPLPISRVLIFRPFKKLPDEIQPFLFAAT